MTEFELQLSILEISGTITDQFQFWMTTTFAVVIACYTAGERLGNTLRLAIASIYIVAVAMFYLRYLDAASAVAYYAELLRALGGEIPARRVGLITFLRKTLMLGGSILALVLIFRPSLTGQNGQNQDAA